MDIKIDLPVVTPKLLSAIGDLYKLASREMENDIDTRSSKTHLALLERSLSGPQPLTTPKPEPTKTEKPTQVITECGTPGVLLEGDTNYKGSPILGADTPLVKEAPTVDTRDDVDAEGVIWNKDIHTRTKSKDTRGCWKTKGTVSPEQIEAGTKYVGGREPSPEVVSKRLAPAKEEDVDVEGVIWDDRIHEPKDKAVAGMWVLREDCSQGFIDSVIAHHKTVEEKPDATVMGEAKAPTNLAEFVSWVSDTDTKASRVKDALSAVGLKSVVDLNGSPEMIAKVYGLLV